MYEEALTALKRHNVKVNSFVVILSAVLLMCVFAPFQSKAANSNILYGDLRLQDNSALDVTSPIINSNLFFSAKLSNNDGISHPYAVIFDVRDSKNYSIALKIESGTIPKYSTLYVRSGWLPEGLGTYTVRTFALSNIETPEVLSSVISKSFEVLASKPILPAVVEQPKPIEQTPPVIQNTTNTPTLDDLRHYALELINKDRAKFGAPPVKLSDNQAAQVHADDAFKNKQISHWMSNGEKPYMTYSRLGGTGDVSQNIGTWATDSEPKESIKKLEYSMMYEDLECCDNGHRDNILDPHHSDVSIGIAYDDSFFVIVQNFENNYITPRYESDRTPIFSYDQKTLSIQGKIVDGEIKWREIDCDEGYRCWTVPIRIYYDNMPTTTDYKRHSTDKSYSLGPEIACVIPGSLSSGLSCNPYKIIGADWNYNDAPESDSFSINLNLSQILQDKGVYTISILAEPPNASGHESHQFPVASYSIWYDGK